MDLRSIAVPDFRRDDAASVTLTFALMAIVLFACIGGLVDYSRWNHAYARTVAAMDATLLVAGRHLQTESDGEAGALAAARQYYEEQVKSRLEVDNPSVTFEIDAQPPRPPASASCLGRQGGRASPVGSGRGRSRREPRETPPTEASARD